MRFAAGLCWLLLASCRANDDAPAPATASNGPATACELDDHCHDGERCLFGLCSIPSESDAGASDAEVPDTALDVGSLVDAGEDVDADAMDAGRMDRMDRGAALPSIDLAGYQLRNAENIVQTATVPAGVVLAPGELLIMARDATRAEFESEWGVVLPPSAHFVSTGASTTGAPIINGGERWSLVSRDGSILDGETIEGRAGRSYQRATDGDPREPATWLDADDTMGSPGFTMLPRSGRGLVISEWSDRSGTGRFVFEFVEIWYDP